MSYEGYERCLCKNGHLHVEDCYTANFDGDWRCPDCGEPKAQNKGVDQTNCSGHPIELEVVQEPQGKKCDKCGSMLKQIEPTRYKIPTEKDERKHYMKGPECPDCGFGRRTECERCYKEYWYWELVDGSLCEECCKELAEKMGKESSGDENRKKLINILGTLNITVNDKTRNGIELLCLLEESGELCELLGKTAEKLELDGRL